MYLSRFSYRFQLGLDLPYALFFSPSINFDVRCSFTLGENHAKPECFFRAQPISKVEEVSVSTSGEDVVVLVVLFDTTTD